jgi:NADPH-dependent glutamate synthase beta subunit-like oxidoreductase
VVHDNQEYHTSSYRPTGHIFQIQVGINAVEQFIGDTAKEKGYKFEFDAKDTGKKVAIIGGGCGGFKTELQIKKVSVIHIY